MDFGTEHRLERKFGGDEMWSSEMDDQWLADNHPPVCYREFIDNMGNHLLVNGDEFDSHGHELDLFCTEPYEECEEIAQRFIPSHIPRAKLISARSYCGDNLLKLLANYEGKGRRKNTRGRDAYTGEFTDYGVLEVKRKW